jgi:glycosyltransferase XagB
MTQPSAISAIDALRPVHAPHSPPVGFVPRPAIANNAVPGTRKRPKPVGRGHVSRLKPLPAEMSAQTTLTRRQVIVIRGVAVGLFLSLLAVPTATAIFLIAVVTLLYLGAFAFRMRIFWRALRSGAEIHIANDTADSLWDHALPTYTVLVPAFREPEVIAQVIGSLQLLDYPAERLDIKLLLEEDDEATIAAAEAVSRPEHIQVVRVPAGEPRTKPRACNYGLALARGKYVTIYDAEDHPEPLQLRRAVAAFRGLDDRYACLQAKLSYHNPGQNTITRWFTTEYAMWFSQLLPGLIGDSAPLPLGGTSNHFRRAVLDEIGGWDAYNVTEDADLGVRLHRAGYRTAVLDSTTYEEANSDFVNWVKQRSRWYKGYMQTWLVHMRHPVELIREIGFGGFLGFNLFVGGTPFLSLVNPFFWALTALWVLGRVDLIDEFFPFWLYYIGLACFALGNLLFIYTNMVAARQAGRPELVLAALLSPLYWVMMSIAAIKAFIQLLHAPSFWEKTAHGLDRPSPQPGRSNAT